MPDQTRYGEIIRERRKGRGWTQAELAERLGTSTGTISRWENSSSTKPGIDQINALCTLLGIPIEPFVRDLGLNLSPPIAGRLPRELLLAMLEVPPQELAGLTQLLMRAAGLGSPGSGSAA